MTSLDRKSSVLIIAVLLVLALFLGINEPLYRNIKNDQLQTVIESDVPLYDLRRPDEWIQTGVIEGSHLLTFVDANGRVLDNFFSRFTDGVGKNEPVILICRTGNRTSALARHLVKELGYTNVYHVYDGITRWI